MFLHGMWVPSPEAATGDCLVLHNMSESVSIRLVLPSGLSSDYQAITRLRKDVVDELSHIYSTHMRRPGRIAFS